MKHAAEKAAADPFDVRALWGMNDAAFGYGENGYRAWLDSATRMQTEAAAFWNDRVGKDVATLTALGQCRNPSDALAMQMEYARDAMADYYAEGQRLMEFMGVTAKDFGLPATSHARTAPH